MAEAEKFFQRILKIINRHNKIKVFYHAFFNFLLAMTVEIAGLTLLLIILHHAIGAFPHFVYVIPGFLLMIMPFAGFIYAGFRTWRHNPTPFHSLQQIDQRHNLYDLLGNGYAVVEAGHDNPFAGAVVAKAMAWLDHFCPEQVNDGVIEKKLLVFPALLLLFSPSIFPNPVVASAPFSPMQKFPQKKVAEVEQKRKKEQKTKELEQKEREKKKREQPKKKQEREKKKQERNKEEQKKQERQKNEQEQSKKERPNLPEKMPNPFGLQGDQKQAGANEDNKQKGQQGQQKKEGKQNLQNNSQNNQKQKKQNKPGNQDNSQKKQQGKQKKQRENKQKQGENSKQSGKKDQEPKKKQQEPKTGSQESRKKDPEPKKKQKQGKKDREPQKKDRKLPDKNQKQNRKSPFRSGPKKGMNEGKKQRPPIKKLQKKQHALKPLFGTGKEINSSRSLDIWLPSKNGKKKKLDKFKFNRYIHQAEKSLQINLLPSYHRQAARRYFTLIRPAFDKKK